MLRSFAGLIKVHLHSPVVDATDSMAVTKMATVLLLLVLAVQLTSLHARSVPGDYDTQEYVPIPSGNTFDTQSDMPSFATNQFDTPLETEQNPYNYDTSLASSDSADSLPFDTFVDSPETINPVVFSQSAYENDEVFFDTSNADTVYRAKDE